LLLTNLHVLLRKSLPLAIHTSPRTINGKKWRFESQLTAEIAMSGWLSPTPLKNDGVKVSWDDEIPN
jgi:hypothetical protein